MSERGAALVLVTASLMFLMGMAAIVVDGGAGLSERRQSQSGVDFASLAALQMATSTSNIATAVENGAAEAQAVVAGNLPGRSLDWGACNDDADRPAEYTRISSVNCISFTHNLEKARVKLPDNAVDASFGPVVGVDSLITSAVAEAMQEVEQSAAVIPLTFGGSGPDVCLYSNQAPQTVPPCNGPSNGNFGYLDIALYGNTEVGTPSTCTSGTGNDRVAINIVIGSDHNIVEHSAGDPIVNDHASCPNRSMDVNQLQVFTGSPKNGITKGMLDGISGFIDGQPIPTLPGRLKCNSTAANASVECRPNIRGMNLDHTGLWEYLEAGACPTAQANETHVDMASCISSWSGGVIFTEDIMFHPRFAAVPVFSSYPTNGVSAPYNIVDFVPVWLETIYMGCNANRCTTIHSPGEPHPTGPPACSDPIAPTEWNCGWNQSGTNAVEALTAFRLDLNMLPLSISEDFPSRKGNRVFALIE